jgi:hypothetical protein
MRVDRSFKAGLVGRKDERFISGQTLRFEELPVRGGTLKPIIKGKQ